MKKTSNVLQLFAAVVIGVSLVPWSHGQIVYDNTALASDQSARFSRGGTEFGDEIQLAAGGRTIFSFSFQYYAVTLGGGETAKLRFYKNDGAGLPGSQQPNASPFFESAAFTIGPTPLGRATINFAATDFTLLGGASVALTIPLPEDFTWSVQFSGIGPVADVGVDLYSPQSVGNSFNDYWDHSGAGGTWLLLTNNTAPFIPYDFAARVTTVPEPTTLWLAILGGLALLGVRLRSSRS